MKNFEKWYTEERKRRAGAPTYSADYRTAWRAALEWVLKEDKKLGYGDFVEDKINEELNT